MAWEQVQAGMEDGVQRAGLGLVGNESFLYLLLLLVRRVHKADPKVAGMGEGCKAAINQKRASLGQL